MPAALMKVTEISHGSFVGNLAGETDLTMEMIGLEYTM
jgi:hypothetical protein